jgi:hypothetical protein
MLPVSFKKRELEIHSARHAYGALDGNFSTQEKSEAPEPRHSNPKAPSAKAAQRSPLFDLSRTILGSKDPTPHHVPRTTE